MTTTRQRRRHRVFAAYAVLTYTVFGQIDLRNFGTTFRLLDYSGLLETKLPRFEITRVELSNVRARL